MKRNSCNTSSMTNRQGFSHHSSPPASLPSVLTRGQRSSVNFYFADDPSCGPIRIEDRIECRPPGVTADICTSHGCCFDPTLMMCYFPGTHIALSVKNGQKHFPWRTTRMKLSATTRISYEVVELNIKD